MFLFRKICPFQQYILVNGKKYFDYNKMTAKYLFHLKPAIVALSFPNKIEQKINLVKLLNNAVWTPFVYKEIAQKGFA